MAQPKKNHVLLSDNDVKHLKQLLKQKNTNQTAAMIAIHQKNKRQSKLEFQFALPFVFIFLEENYTSKDSGSTFTVT